MKHSPFNSSYLCFRHAAVAERGDHPKIHIFDLATARLKKTLVAVDVKGKVSSTPSLR